MLIGRMFTGSLSYVDPSVYNQFNLCLSPLIPVPVLGILMPTLTLICGLSDHLIIALKMKRTKWHNYKILYFSFIFFIIHHYM